MNLGIDEAGRGCAIGSLFMAGVWAVSEVAESWMGAGLKDSKQLNREDRDRLAAKIKEEASSYKIIEVTSAQIDMLNIDHLEFKAMLDLMQYGSLDQRIFIDCPGHRGVWWKAFSDVRDMTNVTLEHKADETYPIVSAASVIAKNARDLHIDFIGAPNGGYSGAKLWEFLDTEFIKHGELPFYVRRSWASVKKFLEDRITD